MMNLGNVANSMVKTPTPYPQGNMEYVSKASTAWANQLAGEDAKRREGMSNMWSSILGGSSLFG
jgi:hypothetical protein